jgi:hypothetical protein
MLPKALLTWFVSGVIAAITIGWLAARIHAFGYAPLGLTSLAIGAMLGAMLAVIAAMLRIAGLRCLLVGVVSSAIVAIVAQHAWLYLDFRGQWKESRTKSPAVAMFRPEEPLAPREYFARDWNPRLWVADAVIITATAIAVVFAARRYFPSLRPPISDL